MTGLSRLYVTQAAHTSMVQHVELSGSTEAVGLLSGKGETASACHPLGNLVGEGAFAAHPYDQYLAERAIARAGAVLLAIYHSHPEGGLRMSSTDRGFAKRRNAVQIIVATRQGRVSGIRAFALRGAREAPIPLIVVADTSVPGSVLSALDIPDEEGKCKMSIPHVQQLS